MIKHPLMFDSSTHICIMIRQIVICTIDQTDGDLHKDQTYFDIEIYRWEHLELKLKSKLKLSNMCAYVILHSLLPKRIVPRLDDKRP